MNTLPEPATPLAETIRRLAEIAMSVTHHDASEDEPGYILEVSDMERRFRPVLLSYIQKSKMPRTAGRRVRS